MVHFGSTKSNWVRAEWILYHCSWKRMYCLRKSLKLIKYEGKLLGSSSPRIENYTNALSLVLTCFVCTLKHRNHFWRSCTKGFVEVIQEEDPCLTELLPKDIGGQTCKKRRRSMSRNAINVRGLRLIFTSLEGFSTLFLIRGLLLNGAWILWDLSPRQWEIKNSSLFALIISLSG